jgi:hypothetical protein
MSKYTGKKYQFPVPLDEVGINAGIIRLKDESLDDYRRRVNVQVKDMPTPRKESVLSTANRATGLFEKNLLKISLVIDSDGIAIVADPRIEIKAISFKVWSDWSGGANAPELNTKISLREGAFFMKDLLPLLSGLPFLNVEVLDEYEDYLKTSNLKICNTDSVTRAIALSSSRLNKLWTGKFSRAYFTNQQVYSKEVNSIDELTEEGDYYINYDRGYIYSFSPGGGDVSVDYSEFPFYLKWQPVKAVEINDETLIELTRDYLIDDDGKSKRLLLNSYGATIANKILKQSPINWGE